MNSSQLGKNLRRHNGASLKALIHFAKMRGMPSKWAWEIVHEIGSEQDIKRIQVEVGRNYDHF